MSTIQLNRKPKGIKPDWKAGELVDYRSKYSNAEMVVMVYESINSQYFSGTVLFIGENLDRFTGEQEKRFAKSEFVKYEGELILTQEVENV